MTKIFFFFLLTPAVAGKVPTIKKGRKLFTGRDQSNGVLREIETKYPSISIQKHDCSEVQRDALTTDKSHEWHIRIFCLLLQNSILAQSSCIFIFIFLSRGSISASTGGLWCCSCFLLDSTTRHHQTQTQLRIIIVHVLEKRRVAHI